jgi:hypothetical protein
MARKSRKLSEKLWATYEKEFIKWLDDEIEDTERRLLWLDDEIENAERRLEGLHKIKQLTIEQRK